MRAIIGCKVGNAIDVGNVRRIRTASPGHDITHLRSPACDGRLPQFGPAGICAIEEKGAVDIRKSAQIAESSEDLGAYKAIASPQGVVPAGEEEGAIDVCQVGDVPKGSNLEQGNAVGAPKGSITC